LNEEIILWMTPQGSWLVMLRIQPLALEIVAYIVEARIWWIYTEFTEGIELQRLLDKNMDRWIKVERVCNFT
jgi:hypothetical protein